MHSLVLGAFDSCRRVSILSFTRPIRGSSDFDIASYSRSYSPRPHTGISSSIYHEDTMPPVSRILHLESSVAVPFYRIFPVAI